MDIGWPILSRHAYGRAGISWDRQGYPMAVTV